MSITRAQLKKADDEFQAKKARGERYIPPHPGCTMEQYIQAVDNFCVNFSRERFICSREAWGGAVSWVFTLDGLEIGRFTVSPILGGGFRKSETSKAPFETRRFWGDIMDDLEWSVKGDLKLRPPGIRVKMHPILDAVRLQPAQAAELTTKPRGKPGPKPGNRAEKIQAWKDWQSVCVRGELTFLQWSEEKWGADLDGNLNVLKSTFYSWPRE